MSNLKKVGLVIASFLTAALVFVGTGNVFASALAMPASSVALQLITGVSLYEAGFSGMAFTVPLVGLKRKAQNPQLGGNKRIYIVLTEYLEKEFLKYADILESGEWNAPIPLLAGKKFVELEAWYDSTKWDSVMKPGAGFTQSLEFDVLGYDKDIAKLMALLYETPVNVIIQGNDDTLVYLGQKYVPMMFEMTGSSPVKGNAQKKVTFKASNEGFTVPAVPLGPLATFAVEALAPAA
ncbi:hypothetical protein [Siphonobacter sp. SORGH_AS_1065]|uniref:hypothetical protein n=1 Tax=Siphonobacter sp. SORGH_AS_1065 TaxID=3041795 RepID=UPI002782CEDD|nr:hypothetical protein [Siphonobacter sp. SORGH_AS_1065]MDQ1085637.1 hypothetical protein [Siphonobacter sp. SORGH_AS_1065]